MDATFNIENNVFNYRVSGVWIENGHVLLYKQADESHWALPGGRAHLMEDSKSCLVHEMTEEMGLQVAAGPLLWVAENFFSYRSKQHHEIGFHYKAGSLLNVSPFQRGSFFGPEGGALDLSMASAERAGASQFVSGISSAIAPAAATQHLIISNTAI